MRNFFVLFTLVLSVVFVSDGVFANESAPAAANAVDISHLLKKPEPMPESDGGLKLKTECVTSSGKTLRKGESGYQSCLQEAAHKVIHNPTLPVGQPTGQPVGTKGISVGTGTSR